MLIRIWPRKCRLTIPLLALLGGMFPAGAHGGTWYGYDALGRLTTTLYDNGLCVVYAYDASGNRTSQINYVATLTSRPVWGTATWGSFNWTSAPQWPIWGIGSWGCFAWTP